MAEPDSITAIKEGDASAVEEAVRRDPSSAAARGDSGLSAVLIARYYGRTEILDTLLGLAPELDAFEAAAVGDVERVCEVVERDPGLVGAWSTDGFTPLHLACFFGDPETARGLLEAGADVGVPARNPMHVQPLHSAAARGQVEIARELLARGADPNARQEGGFVPLQAAAQNGDEALARLLTDHGADPALADDSGKTAADHARDAGHDWWPS